MLKILFYLQILFYFIIYVKSESIIPKLGVKTIQKYHKSNNTLLMLYINPLNFTHKSLLETFTQVKIAFPNYTYGYVDEVKDKDILNFFKLKDINDSGFIVYRFKDETFYIEENVHNISQIIEIINKIEDKSLNWFSTSIIEKAVEFITGKKYGKKAHTYFSFAICLISIFVYTAVNVWAKRQERKEIEKRFKKD